MDWLDYGLNDLLIGIARQKGNDGVYLLGEIRYLNIPQPRSVHAILGKLTKILGIKVELSGLERQAEEMKQKLEGIREIRTPEVGRQREPRYIN